LASSQRKLKFGWGIYANESVNIGLLLPTAPVDKEFNLFLYTLERFERSQVLPMNVIEIQTFGMSWKKF
jgi:hypothetical protein